MNIGRATYERRKVKMEKKTCVVRTMKFEHA